MKNTLVTNTMHAEHVFRFHDKTNASRFMLFLNLILVLIITGLLITAMVFHYNDHDHAKYLDWIMSFCFLLSLILVVLENAIDANKIDVLMTNIQPQT